MLRSIVYFSCNLLGFINLDAIHSVAIPQIDGVGVSLFVGVPSCGLALTVLVVGYGIHCFDPLSYFLTKVYPQTGQLSIGFSKKNKKKILEKMLDRSPGQMYNVVKIKEGRT